MDPCSPSPLLECCGDGNSNEYLLDRQCAQGVTHTVSHNPQVPSGVPNISSLRIQKWRLRKLCAHRHAGLDFRPGLHPALTLPSRRGTSRGLTAWIMSRFGHLVCEGEWSQRSNQPASKGTHLGLSTSPGP